MQNPSLPYHTWYNVMDRVTALGRQHYRPVLMITTNHWTFDSSVVRMRGQGVHALSGWQILTAVLKVLQLHNCTKVGRTMEKELTTATWLSYEQLDYDYVATLKCKIYDEKLVRTRNFNCAFVDGCSIKTQKCQTMESLYMMCCSVIVCTTYN